MSGKPAKLRRLVAPDLGSVDTIWRNPLPFVLWPIGAEPLLAHWMDDTVRSGFDEVEVYVSDRPVAVRVALEEGVYWSLPVKVIPIASEADAPPDAERVDRLPSAGTAARFSGNGAQLLAHWFDLQKSWLLSRDNGDFLIDRQQPDGGWVAPGARIDPTAELKAPYWIGENARIGVGCRIGPDAFIGADSILEDHVEVEGGCVLPNTCMGQRTRVHAALADGSALVDWERAARVDIHEGFIMRPVVSRMRSPSVIERMMALLFYWLLTPLAVLINRTGWSSRDLSGADSNPLRLRTGADGPLWVRRWPWLWEIARGKLRWIGILPRSEEDWNYFPKEVVHQMRTSRCGMFSLADLHGCHDPSDPEESIHAIYQALHVDPRTQRLVMKNLWKIAWSK
jgi:hypothetical protein